jgi:sigma-B regulation protein RsbQ
VLSQGDGDTTLLLVHGYGCDQTMWRYLAPLLARRHRVVTYDLMGCGGSDLTGYDEQRYATLHGHADDLLQVLEACAPRGKVALVGHSVAAMIGMLATIRQPQRFASQIMIGPSPCYINDGDYVGGYNEEDIDGLLQFMQDDFHGWADAMAPVIMGAPDRPELARQLSTRFRSNSPAIARHFGRVAFTADHRADVPRSSVPALILQCSDDLIAPREVGEYLRRHLPNSMLAMIANVGHCPHFSQPDASYDYMSSFLATTL